MGFGDLKSASGLKVLNGFLSDRSYIEGLKEESPLTEEELKLSSSSGSLAFDVKKWLHASVSVEPHGANMLAQMLHEVCRNPLKT